MTTHLKKILMNANLSNELIILLATHCVDLTEQKDIGHSIKQRKIDKLKFVLVRPH